MNRFALLDTMSEDIQEALMQLLYTEIIDRKDQILDAVHNEGGLDHVGVFGAAITLLETAISEGGI